MLLGIPMIIMYRLSAITFWIAQKLIRIPYIGMPNILAGRAIVPELIQSQANATSIATEAIRLLKDNTAREKMRADLLALRTTLQSGGTARAADEILRQLNG